MIDGMSLSRSRGRTSLETQAAAIAGIAATHADRDTILAARDRVVSSPPFLSSRRARELFSTIVDLAVSGRTDELRERSLGCAVFNREPAYDTGTDAIVRVAASDVRKRLHLYYTQFPGDPVIFELPTGSYIPTIRIAPKSPLAPPSLPAPPPVAPTLQPLPPPASPRNLWRNLALATWLLVLIALAITAIYRASAPAAAQTATQKDPLGLPWSALLRGSQPISVIVPDSSMGSLRNLKPFPPSLEDFANKRFLNPDPSLSPALQSAWRGLAVGRNTSIVSARLAARVAALAVSHDKNFNVRSARELSLSDLQNASGLVLLGSSNANPWVILYEDQMAFRILTSPDSAQYPFIPNPAPGDPRDLGPGVPSGSTGPAWAVLALVSSLGGKGSVLIAAGTNTEGTEMAGDLALDPDKLAPILKGCGLNLSAPAPHFEILLRLDVTAGSRRNARVLATRCSPSP